MQDKGRRVDMSEKNRNGEKCRSNRAAGTAVLLVKVQHDPILFLVNTDKLRSETQDTIRKAAIIILWWPKYVLLCISPSLHS